MLRAIQRYIAEHKEKEKGGGFVPQWQHGSTFFNSGYVDYLDENYVHTHRNPQSEGSGQSAFMHYENERNTDWNDVFLKAWLLQEEGF